MKKSDNKPNKENKLNKFIKSKRMFTHIISTLVAICLVMPAILGLFSMQVSAASRQISLNTSYDDSLSSSSPNNYYFFDMPYTGSVIIKFDMPYYIRSNYWRISIVDYSDNSVLQLKDFGASSSSATSGTKTEYGDRINLSSGRYYISVAAVDANNVATNEYKISVTVDASASSAGDDYEKEPNDTVTTAVPLNLNYSITGSVNTKTDVDYYKVNLPTPGAVIVAFSVSSAIDSGNWIMLLYDKNERQIQMSRVGYGGSVSNLIRTNRSDKVRLPAGDYYIKIAAYSETAWSASDYKIIVNYTAEPGSRYEKEPNDTVETANRVLINAAVTGNLSNGEDYDYFKLSVASYQEVTLRITNPESVGRNAWTVYLFDEKGGIATYNVGNVGASVNSVRTFISETIYLDAGQYYIAVYAYPLQSSSVANADYSLLVHSESAPVPSISDEEYIDYPTERPSTAYNVNRDLHGRISGANDENTFDFGLNHSGVVSVSFRYPSSVTKQSWTVNIFDKNNKLLHSFKCGGDTQDGTGSRRKTSDRIRVPEGSYYIQVVPVNPYDYSSNEYTLIINYTAESKEALSSSVELYEKEYNNTFYTSNEIVLNQSITGNISDFNDADYFTFTADHSGNVKIYFNTSKSVLQNNWIVELFSSDFTSPALYEGTFGADGKDSAVNSAYREGESQSFRLPQGTYYAKVRAYNNIHFSNEDYMLRAAFTDESTANAGNSVNAWDVELYENESNDAPSNSDLLPINTDIKGRVSNTGDLDYYKIFVNESKEIQIKFTMDSSVNSSFWAVKVFDSQLRELKSYRIGESGMAIPASDKKYVKTEKIALTSGEYYVCVSSYDKINFSATEYILKVLDEVGQRIDIYVYAADKPSDWALREVEYSFGYNLVPQSYMRNFTSPIKREEFCILIVRFLEAAENKHIDEILSIHNRQINPHAFTDTNDSQILAAHALGIVNGRGNNIFDPNGNITREEAATMLMRLGTLANITTNITSLNFNDAYKFNTWSEDAIKYVSGCIDNRSNRVMNGYTDGGFHPTDPYSREQAFMTIFRLFSIKTGV